MFGRGEKWEKRKQWRSFERANRTVNYLGE